MSSIVSKKTLTHRGVQKMITLQPKQEKRLVITSDYANESGKLGRHNLSFKTRAQVDRKKQARKNACRNKGRNRISEYWYSFFLYNSFIHNRLNELNIIYYKKIHFFIWFLKVYGYIKRVMPFLAPLLHAPPSVGRPLIPQIVRGLPFFSHRNINQTSYLTHFNGFWGSLSCLGYCLPRKAFTIGWTFILCLHIKHLTVVWSTNSILDIRI